MNFLSDELIEGFVKEVETLTSEIITSIESYKQSGDTSELDKAYAQVSNINESSSLLGFDVLSHISSLAKEVLKENSANFDEKKYIFLENSLTGMNRFAEGILSKNLKQVDILTEVVKSYRRLNNLPEEMDQEFLLDLATRKLNLKTVDGFLNGGEERTEITLNMEDINSVESTESGPDNISKGNGFDRKIDSDEFEDEDDILEIFSLEANELITNIKNRLAKLQDGNDDPENLTEIRRSYHTIKGAAGMIGIENLSELSRRMEKYVENISENSLGVTDNDIEVINNSSSLIDHIVNKKIEDSEAGHEINQLFTQLDKLASDNDAVESILSREQEISPFISYKSRAIDENTELKAENSDAQIFEEETISTDFIADDLMDIFKVEADELLNLITQSLPKLSSNPDDSTYITDIRRAFHTLKGASSMVGASDVSRISHRMEDILDEIYDNTSKVTPANINLIFNSTDLLEDIINNKISSPANIESRINDLFEGIQVADSSIREEQTVISTQETETSVNPFASFKQNSHLLETASVSKTEDYENVAATALSRKPGDFVRISTDKLDQLINLISELFISRSVFEQEFGNLKNEFEELKPSIERLKKLSGRIDTDYEASKLAQQGKVTGTGNDTNLVYFDNPGTKAYTSSAEGFDELEFDRYTEFHLFSRELAETANDVSSVGTQIENVIDNFDKYQGYTSNLISEIEDEVMKFRMVPLSSLSSRLQRIVRNTAEANGKLADLEIIGELAEFDKTILEEISDPLIHILRNSVYHGIERPRIRKDKNKPERGNITVNAYYEGTQIVIKISDDGRGLDKDLLKQTAVKKGILTGDIEEITEQELFSLIYLPGFSTAGELSEISGRGVGMDIVKATIDKMKGTISIDSNEDVGVTFTIRLPMSLSISRVLMVESGRQTFAIPSADIIKVLRAETNNFKDNGEDVTLEIDEDIYPVVNLSDALNLKYKTDEMKQYQIVIIVNTGELQVALVVDEIKDEKEIVIKSLGNHLKNVQCISGATLTGDGSVILIINTKDLHDTKTFDKNTAQIQHEITDISKPHELDVIIVDDSISVRRILSKTIKLMGWNPITARDGLEAFEIVQNLKNKPDVILLDIEMPRMDGYELTTTLRSSDEFKDIPIIMITSRAGDKHRTRAFEIGVSDYLVKPYQDEILISKIREHAGIN